MSRGCRTNATACDASICCIPWWKSAPEKLSRVFSLTQTVMGWRTWATW